MFIKSAALKITRSFRMLNLIIIMSMVTRNFDCIWKIFLAKTTHGMLHLGGGPHRAWSWGYGDHTEVVTQFKI